ncbi:MAG TPA: tripartite tricarboxylate transporter substrate-binding protein, partial [Ramlibacter sp.]|nr:tripartite tricarboxylate transporter substrate-binding protein [Ramlibacter sp.]
YRGVASAVPDVVGNRVGFMMGTPTSLSELMKSGALRALAITSATRSRSFPYIPTFKELGLGDATFDIWVGLMAPAATPKGIRARISDAIEAARRDPQVIARLEGMGQVISDVRTPEQFDAVLKSEDEKYKKLIKDAGIEAS